MARVLVTRRLPDGGLDELGRAGHDVIGPAADDVPYSHEQLVAFAGDVDAMITLLTDRVDEEVLTAGAAAHLRIVANVAVGFDNVDWRAAQRLSVLVSNTPGVLDETTADTAFLLILAAARLASTAEADLRADRWPGWGINQYLGVDVHGATLGIVGYGRIGRAVAARAAGFDMTVLHHSRNPSGDAGYVADLDELLERCDIVTLHTPGGPETHHLIDERRIGLLGPHAVLVNTARGTVVDEVALARALQERRIFAAGIDVYEREPAIDPDLLTAPNAVLLPHIGSASQATRRSMAQLAANAVISVLAGATPPNLVF
jgi:lactate dehydrogenase-like 2-hydroxyacid dehydrogenase